MRISPLVIIGCYQLTDMIPPPPATRLMLPDIHSIEFLDGCYFVHAPPATFWSVKCLKVAEVKDLMNSTNQWLKTIINLVNFAAQTQIRRSEPTFTALKPRGSWYQNSTFLQSLLSLDFDIGRGWGYYRARDGPDRTIVRASRGGWSSSVQFEALAA